MKRFVFRLKTLLELRIRREEQIMLRLADKHRSVAEKQQELATLHNELKELQVSQRSTRAVADSVVELRYSVAYRFHLKRKMLTAGRAIDDMLAEASFIQKELVIATQKRRAIELVKENKKNEWKKEQRLEEQQFIDDIAQKGYIRALRS